ncbi:hypothetical protein V8G54_023847, partial [Vigna mungo]
GVLEGSSSLSSSLSSSELSLLSFTFFTAFNFCGFSLSSELSSSSISIFFPFSASESLSEESSSSESLVLEVLTGCLDTGTDLALETFLAAFLLSSSELLSSES